MDAATGPLAPAVNVPQPHQRASTFRLCVEELSPGVQCKCAALRGSDRCRHHSEVYKRVESRKVSDSIVVVPLPSLVSLDVTDDARLKEFRRGLLAHVGRGTLGVQEARAMHELAQSIHDAAHKDDQTKGFTDLASSIAKELGS